MAGRPAFITFEGGEGSGKTTQIRLLSSVLEKTGRRVILTREPGGSPGAEAIRKLLLVEADGVDTWDPVAETLLFCAARRDHVTKVIEPALAQGATVLCDRFADSTMVYQGIAHGLGLEYVRMLHGLAVGAFSPGLTLLFDLDPEIGLARARSRQGTETRFEALDIAFHRRIREGFMALASAEPHRIRLVNAEQDVASVHAQVLEIMGEHGYR